MDLALLITFVVIVTLYAVIIVGAYLFKREVDKRFFHAGEVLETGGDDIDQQAQINYRIALREQRKKVLGSLNILAVILTVLAGAVVLTWVVSRIVISYQ